MYDMYVQVIFHCGEIFIGLIIEFCLFHLSRSVTNGRLVRVRKCIAFCKKESCRLYTSITRIENSNHTVNRLLLKILFFTYIILDVVLVNNSEMDFMVFIHEYMYYIEVQRKKKLNNLLKIW